MPSSWPSRSNSTLPNINQTKKFNGKIVILTGEVSGEIHGAALLDKLQAFHTFEVSGMGSRRLEEKGVLVIHDYKNISLTGLSEVFSKLKYIREARRQVVKHLVETDPSLLILVDFPGFNLGIAKIAHKLGIPIIYFIPPQIWAWHESRALRIKKYVDKVICILPFEKGYYDRYGIDSTYVGHPFMKTVRPSLSRGEFFKKIDIDGTGPIVTVMPGSRENEVRRHAATLSGIVSSLGKKTGKLTILLPLAENISEDVLSTMWDGGVLVKPLRGMTHDALFHSDLALIASGSATLEAAILGTPAIVIYRVSRFSYYMAKALVKVKYISLPNIIAGREVFPEFIQRMEIEKIAERAFSMLSNGKKKMSDDLEEIREMLGEMDSYGIAAKRIFDFLKARYGTLS